MSPKVSLTIGHARGVRSVLSIYVCVCVCVRVSNTWSEALYSFLLDSFTTCKQMLDTSKLRASVCGDTRSDSDEMFA